MSILFYPTSSEIIRISEGPAGPIGPAGPAGTGQFDPTNVDTIGFVPRTGVATHTEGCIYWNSIDHTLTAQTEIPGTELNIGQENFQRVVNKTNYTILDGSVVYVNGAQGNRPTVDLAIASTKDISHKTLGLATSDIPVNQEGYITVFGLVKGLNTSSTNVGDILYLSPNISGAYTNIRPTYPNYAMQLGQTLLSHSQQGIINVKVDRADFGRTLLAENSVPASTLGTIVKKVEIFNCSGDSLGFIPIYNSIS
jgi:hypothetical protein